MNRNLFRAPLLALCLAFAAVVASPIALAQELQPVNINTADAKTLAEQLVGVGLSRAEAIVEYRKTHGAFQDAYELTAVKGIGERTVERNEPRIRLQD